MIFHRLPIVVSLTWVRFRSIHHAVGIELMVGLVFGEHIIVSARIEQSEIILGVFPSAMNEETRHSFGHSARAVELANLVAQHRPDFHALRDVRLRNFIADAPHDDGWMVAVALHHTREVTLPPLVEEAGIVVGVLVQFPHIGEFIDHEDAQLIAGIEERLRRWIMRATDGIITVGFHHFHAPIFGTVDGCRTQKSVIVVNASALEQQRFAIQQKTAGGRKRYCSDAEGLRVTVHQFAMTLDCDLRAIHIWFIHRPQPRMQNVHRLLQGGFG